MDALWQAADGRYYAALRIICDHGAPIGSGQLAAAMQGAGVPISEATAGRLLRDLELQGAVTKASQRGRVLSPGGERLLTQLASQREYAGRSRELTDLLQRADREHVMQVLEARRGVEGEAAALAARHASDSEIAAIDRIVVVSQDHLAQGTYSAEDDDRFHSAIARSSRNKVLETVVRLIRESESVSQVLMQIRNRVGHKTLFDHEAILLGIRSRDPEMARAAMLFHVERVRLDAVTVFESMAHPAHRELSAAKEETS